MYACARAIRLEPDALMLARGLALALARTFSDQEVIVARSSDSCVVYTVHAYDEKTGKELSSRASVSARWDDK